MIRLKTPPPSNPAYLVEIAGLWATMSKMMETDFSNCPMSKVKHTSSSEYRINAENALVISS
jgi:hypothetical protein